MSSNQHINAAALEELRDIMEDDFALLIDTFVADSEKRIETLKTAIAESDAEQVRGTAHSFKGSSSNICAPLLSDLCRDLEDTAREGNLSCAPALFADIQTEFNTVRQLLSQL